ncbi:hypothetical protein GCM10027262_65250 [Nocardia tengchongensis]
MRITHKTGLSIGSTIDNSTLTILNKNRFTEFQTAQYCSSSTSPPTRFDTGSGQMSTPSGILHLHVEMGPLILDYRGHAEQIGEVATELTAAGAATVSIDEMVNSEMPCLPCSRLWAG